MFWKDSKLIAKLKYAAYLANGYTTYLGWNSNNYTLDGHPKPSSIPSLPVASKEQIEAAKLKLQKQVDIMFARRGRV